MFFSWPLSSHLKHATFCKLKSGFFVVSTCQPPSNTSNALPRKAIQVERRCPRLWCPRLWQDVGTSNRFQQVRAQVIFSFFRKSHPASSKHKKSTPAQPAQRRGAAPCGAVRCRAVPCCAVRCRAVLCRAVPCCAVLYRAVPCCAVLCCNFSSAHTRRQR